MEFVKNDIMSLELKGCVYMKRVIQIIIVLTSLVILFGCKPSEDSIVPVDYSPLVTDNNLREDEETDVDVCTTFTLFEYAPVNLDKTKVFLPLGLMTGSHVTPIDHHYFQNFDNTEYDIEIYSPGDGIITDVQHMPGAAEGEDYRVVVDHGCGISSVFIHLGVFSDDYLDIAPELQGKEYIRVNVPVKAGELIGYYKRNVDYNIVDLNTTLDGFINKESYLAESWKLHIPNTYDYFDERVRNELLSISLRTIEPISGKIDYDIEGRLVGNWFLQGTNGYAGSSTETKGYWMGHLAIAYDAYDPTRIVFSIGGYKGEDSKQFAVRGNSPDPADVSIESGIIKYELVNYDYITKDGDYWNRSSLEPGLSTIEYEVIEAVLLVQVLENNVIEFEVFENMSLEEVNNFTNESSIYER